MSPLEDVERLGQFVEAGLAQQLSKFGQPHLVGQEVPLPVSLVGHGAEFVELKDFFTLARPVLCKEHRAAELEPHQQGDEGEQPAKDEDRREGADNV